MRSASSLLSTCSKIFKTSRSRSLETDVRELVGPGSLWWRRFLSVGNYSEVAVGLNNSREAWGPVLFPSPAREDA